MWNVIVYYIARVVNSILRASEKDAFNERVIALQLDYVLYFFRYTLFFKNEIWQ